MSIYRIPRYRGERSKRKPIELPHSTTPAQDYSRFESPTYLRRGGSDPFDRDVTLGRGDFAEVSDTPVFLRKQAG
jgi:hypothetical protein